MKIHAMMITLLCAALAYGQTRVESGPGAGVRGTRVTSITSVTAEQVAIPTIPQPEVVERTPFRDAISNLMDAAGLDMSIPAKQQVKAVVSTMNVIAEGIREGRCNYWESPGATYGEPRYFGDRFNDEPAPLQASSLTTWWKKLWAKVKAAINGDDDDPVAPLPTPTPTPDPVTPPSETPVNTFLWKPTSDNDGKLVVLLPANLDASTVTVNGENPAAYTGRGNGDRQHFRFRNPGASYGLNVAVVAKLKTGGDKKWIVPKGGDRWSSN
jgi:hypothetical protein